MESMDRIASFWEKFLKDTGREEQKYFECFHFDSTEEWANKLLALVLDGRKKATSSSIYFFERKGLPLPKVGDLSIVTDWAGTPHCVIQTTKVTILPFRDITYDICKREGEDDSLESWRRGHIRFFTEEGNAQGYEFHWDMPVVFEDFGVVYTAPSIPNQ